MQGVGSFLYLLSEKDKKSLGIQIYREKFSNTAATGTVASFRQVPNDRVVLLACMSVNLNPLASGDIARTMIGLTGTYTSATAIPGNAVDIWSSMRGFDLFYAGAHATDVYDSTEFEGLIIPAGSAIGAFGTFSGAGGNHTVTVNLYGVTIPRGNIAF